MRLICMIKTAKGVQRFMETVDWKDHLVCLYVGTYVHVRLSFAL